MKNNNLVKKKQLENRICWIFTLNGPKKKKKKKKINFNLYLTNKPLN